MKIKGCTRSYFFFASILAPRASILRREGARRGFTLVEILVAIAILAVVLSTIYVSFISTMRVVKSLEYGDEIYYMARITLERMVLDLQSACKDKDSYEFATLKDSTGRLPMKGVSFLSRAHLDFSGPGDTMAVAQISYEARGRPGIRRVLHHPPGRPKQGEGASGGEGFILCKRLQLREPAVLRFDRTRVSRSGTAGRARKPRGTKCRPPSSSSSTSSTRTIRQPV